MADRLEEGGFAEATRIVAGDDRTQYDWVARNLHWLTVGLVLLQFALSQIWGFFGKPVRHGMVVTHMSFGIVLGAVVLLRILWRLIPGHRVPPLVTGWVERASRSVHWLLYGLLLLQAALGFALRWSGNESMSFFGLAIAPPFPPTSKPVHEALGELHENVGWAIIGLASAHALAALYHHFVLRDRVLLRMLPGGAVSTRRP